MMRTTGKTRDCRYRASTLVELVVALTVLVLVILGHSIAGYHARLDIQRAQRHSTAANTALLLCESWAGAGGGGAYDPVANLASQLIITAGNGPEAPVDFTSRGSYCVTIDGVSYSATLSSRELAAALRALNVTVAWPSRYGSASPDRDYSLTTYVLLD
jgi:hypothetical protein